MANEKRLIDAKAFHYRVSQHQMTELFPNWKELPEEVQEMLCKHGKYLEMLLETEPSVDAVEVVHGRWVHMCEGRYLQVICTACGTTAIKVNTEYFSNLKVEWDYCPNCGAKMDGGNEDGC